MKTITHKGVKIRKIYRMVSGSDFDFTVDGRLKNTKPEFEGAYCYADGYPEDSVQAAKKAIDNVLRKLKILEEKIGNEVNMKQFAETMNEGEPPRGWSYTKKEARG